MFIDQTVQSYSSQRAYCAVVPRKFATSHFRAVVICIMGGFIQRSLKHLKKLNDRRNPIETKDFGVILFVND